MGGQLNEVVGRRILPILTERAAEEPVIALHGPRSVGKSTLLREFAASHGAEVVDLDDPAVLDAVRASPSLALDGPLPACIDEYQHAPEILDAIKARLNATGTPAGFAVLTGSTRHDALPRTAQALTGRLAVLTILPLSQGEITGQREDLLSVLFTDPDGAVAAHPRSATTRTQYVQRVCAGGFPLALRRTGASRERWFDSYIRLSIERDSLELSKVQQRDTLRRLLDRLAGQTGQVLNMTKAGSDLGIQRHTLNAYAQLLEDLYLVQRLPAWGTTLRARAASSPKIHVLDSGVAARLLRLSEAKLASLDPSALTEFGNLMETFVVGELRKQASWLARPVAVGHWRTRDGDEVDFIAEDDNGRVIALEVKAGERVTGSDLKGLRKLRDALGNRLIAAIALTTGPRSYTYEDRLHVLPIDRLWRNTGITS